MCSHDAVPRTDTDPLLARIRACRVCEHTLEHGVNPVLQFSPKSRIVIAGQAPGSRVHESGIPFDDPSGDRLRSWLGVTSDEFYDPCRFAILPMAFCYPGSTKSGDKPPPRVCADEWRQQLLDQMLEVELIVVIGRYAADWHIGARKEKLADLVRQYSKKKSQHIVLPHPSPRNNIWLRRHSWFEEDVLPRLKRRVRRALGGE